MKPLFSFLLIGLVVIASSCGDDDEPTPDVVSPFQEWASASVDGINVKLLGQERFFVGYNTMMLEVFDNSDQPITGEVKITPMMDMMTMSHSAPLEYTHGQALNAGGALEFATVFVMPSGEMGTWTVNVEVLDKMIEVPVEVLQPEYSRLTSFVDQVDGSTKYFVAMISPKDPQVGVNDLKVAVYKRQSMMEWPAVTDMTMELEPWMVSMDHGSPNNVAPVHTGNGHYSGKVNFTMTGDWQIRLDLLQNGELCGEPYFDIFFQ